MLCAFGCLSTERVARRKGPTSDQKNFGGKAQKPSNTQRQMRYVVWLRKTGDNVKQIPLFHNFFSVVFFFSSL